MSEFKNFIKGFEEKPEAKNPNPAPTPKPQEVKMGKPKEQPKPNKVSYELHFGNDDDEARLPQFHKYEDREMALNKAAEFGERGQNAYVKVRGKDGKLYDLKDYELTGEDKPTPKPQPKEGSFGKMMQGFEQPKMATEKKAEQYHEPKPQLKQEGLTDEDIKEELESGRFATFEEENKTIDEAAASLGKSIGISPERAKQALLNIYGKDYWQELPKAEQPQEAPTPEASLSSYFNDNSFKKSGYGDHNYENDSGEEYWVGTYEEAEEAAKEDVRNFIDDAGIGGFADYFQDWINDYAVDENFISQLQEEEADYYESEGDRDTAEWIRNTDPDNFQQYMVDNLGLKEWRDILMKNNAYDIDKIVDEAVRIDGIGHFLAYYDGDEIELPNGLYAYRQN